MSGLLKIFSKKARRIPAATQAASKTEIDQTALSATAQPIQGLPANPPDQQSPSSSSVAQTLKHASLFALQIAGNVSVPWVKFVTESIIIIVKRIDATKANKESAEQFGHDIQAFLCIVAMHAEKNPNEEATAFQKKIQSMLEHIPDPGFLDAAATEGLIANLRRDLNTAIQLLQTSYQLALADSLDELKQRNATIENSIRPGNINQNISGVTLNTEADINAKTEGKATVTSSLTGTNMTAGKKVNRHIQGATVNDTLLNSNITAKEDININVFATG